jgi:hypothetical protein
MAGDLLFVQGNTRKNLRISRMKVIRRNQENEASSSYEKACLRHFKIST